MFNKKRLLSLSLSVLMGLSGTLGVAASGMTEAEIHEDQAWTAMQLDNMYAYIDQMWAQKQALQAQIADMDYQLFNIMAVIEVTNNDIAVKEADIARTSANLERAKNSASKQYESMKARLAYLYENGGDDAWFQMILNAEDLSDLLNRAEYTQKMYDQDKKNLETFNKTVTEVELLQAQYETEQAELQEMKLALEQQSAELEYQIAVKQEQSYDCDNEIAYAQYMATEYANWLIYLNQELVRLEEGRRRAEEEARRQAAIAAAQAAAAQAAAEEEARRQAAAQAAYTAQVAASAYDEPEYDEYGNVIDNSSSYSGYNDYSDYSGYTDNSGYSDYSDNSGSSSGYSSGSSMGSDIVNFATQFVGNPYVWGGTSLTNGADCSGFVQSVYSNFGIDLPRTSYEQEYAGYEVSYSDAQPGDLICYGSHVAIYMGDGQIVHASNSRDGIKISDNAAYQTITSVRRLV